MPRINESPPCLRRVFGLVTPQHILQKLCWENKRLVQVIESQHDSDFNSLEAVYCAFNTAVTAWHLSDWVWESAPKELRIRMIEELGGDLAFCKLANFQEALIETNRSLEICKNIANGSKHRTDRGDSSIRAYMDWIVLSERRDEIEVTSKYEYRLVICDAGKIMGAPEIFDCVSNFWQSRLAAWGFVELELIGETAKVLEVRD